MTRTRRTLQALLAACAYAAGTGEAFAQAAPWAERIEVREQGRMRPYDVALDELAIVARDGARIRVSGIRALAPNAVPASVTPGHVVLSFDRPAASRTEM